MNKKELFETGLKIRELSQEIYNTEDTRNFSKLKMLKNDMKKLSQKFEYEAYGLYKLKYGQYPYAFIGIETGYIYYKYTNNDVILIDFGVAETVPYDYRKYKNIDEMFAKLSKIKATKGGRIIQKDISFYVNRLSCTNIINFAINI